MENFKKLGFRTESHQQIWRRKKKKAKKTQLTMEQRSALLATVYRDDGNCVLCGRCFQELTEQDLAVRRALAKKINEGGIVPIFSLIPPCCKISSSVKKERMFIQK